MIPEKKIKPLLKHEGPKQFQLFFELFCFEACPLYVAEVHPKHSNGLQ